MDKIRTILVIMLFFGAALAGCTGEEVEKVVEENTENDANNNNTNNTADDTNNTADDTNNTAGETNTAVYSATDILAMLGVDGSDDAELDFMAPADNQEKFGIHMIITAPMDTLGLTDDEGSPSSVGDEDVEIVVINMFDNNTKRVASHMVMTMNMGGMSMEIQMKDTQGQHPEFSNAGYINQVMTNMDTYQPEAMWLIDNKWSYEEALEEIFPEDEEEDDHEDHGDHDSHVDHGDHHDMTFVCGDGSEILLEFVNDDDEDCDDGSDEQQYDVDGNPINWFECNDGTGDIIWINQVNDGHPDCLHALDEVGPGPEGQGMGDDGMTDIEETEIGPDMPEPTAEELSAVNWTTSIDETSGMQTFTGIVTMEGAGEWTYELAIMPTVPPVMKSLKMENDTESFDISLLYGDEVVIELVTEDTPGWDRGASDLWLDRDESVFHEEICTNSENEDAATKLMWGGYEECTSFDWRIEEEYNEDGDAIGVINEGCWNYHTEEWYDTSPHDLNYAECNAFEGTLIHEVQIEYTLFGEIEVMTAQLEIHILTPAYDENGDSIDEQTVLANITVHNQPAGTDASSDQMWMGSWTDDDGFTWTVNWICNSPENSPGVVSENCAVVLYTSGMMEVTGEDGDTWMEGPKTNFDVKLYDLWAEDYTGNPMPSFTLGLSIIALLGACLSRRKLE